MFNTASLIIYNMKLKRQWWRALKKFKIRRNPTILKFLEVLPSQPYCQKQVQGTFFSTIDNMKCTDSILLSHAFTASLSSCQNLAKEVWTTKNSPSLAMKGVNFLHFQKPTSKLWHFKILSRKSNRKVSPKFCHEVDTSVLNSPHTYAHTRDFATEKCVRYLSTSENRTLKTSY